MSDFSYSFEFNEGDSNRIQGEVSLNKPLPCCSSLAGSGFYRHGEMSIAGFPNLELVLYHNPATARFMYLRKSPVDHNLLDIIGLPESDREGLSEITLPGQLCMGPDRSTLIGQAIYEIVGAPVLKSLITTNHQENLAVFPIAREGLKYQIADAIYANYGYYCDEVILDAHHIFDMSVPVYNRKVEMTLFKDKDLDKQQHEIIKVALLGDSIASGLVMKEVITRVKERFNNIEHVEVIAPLATIRGLCRIARSEMLKHFNLRVHVFDTLLNALPPDYYYSAHFNLPGFHIRPDLEAEYRDWWGFDNKGRAIADTTCAGYGWSEVFYAPRKQIEMMNSQLVSRHGLTITDIIRRNIQKQPVGTTKTGGEA